MATRDTIEGLKQPKYTGQNRCTPCTIVNIGIAAVVSTALAFVTPVLGVATFTGFVGVIYLRGYLVPGTPTLTERYLPDRVLGWFDKDPAPDHALGINADGDVDPEDVFVDIGVLEFTDGGDELRLVADFRETWHAHLDRLREGEEAPTALLAELLNVRPDRLQVIDRGPVVSVELEGREVGQWESRAALLADLSADSALKARNDDWTDLSADRRSFLLSSVRVFLDRCPECGGRVRLLEETVESCCRSREVIAGGCTDCESRLFEVDRSDIDTEAA